MIGRTLLLLGTLLSLAIPAVGIEAQGSQGYALRPGDEITLAVFTQSGEVLQTVGGVRYLDRDGRIYLPFVGSVQLGGLDTNAARTLLERSFSQLYDRPVVDVVARLRVNVTGAVRIPGSYFLIPSATIADALAAAGGDSGEVYGGMGIPADLSAVRVVRGSETRLMDLRAESFVSSEVRDMLIQSGDWIYVPPQQRAALRENIQLASGILSVVGSVIALIVLVAR